MRSTRWIYLAAALMSTPTWSDEKPMACQSLSALESPPAGNQTCRTEYTVGHDLKTGDLRWVHYRLSPSNLIVSSRLSPSVIANKSSRIAFSDPDYDAAQLVPPSLNSFSEQAFDEARDSLVTMPMHKHLHRKFEYDGDWAAATRWESQFAAKRPGVHVFSGPIYGDLDGKVWPTHYFKVYYDVTIPAMLAMIFSNKAGINDARLAHNIVTVDCVEERTGLNFFAGVPDENDLENATSITIKHWTMIDGDSHKNGCQ